MVTSATDEYGAFQKAEPFLGSRMVPTVRIQVVGGLYNGALFPETTNYLGVEVEGTLEDTFVCCLL